MTFKISPTKLATWQSCQYKYFLSYIERWEQVEEPAKFAKGNFGHAALEIFYRAKKEADRDPVETLREFIMESPNSEWGKRLHFDSLASASTLLIRYIPYALREDRDWEVIAVEEPFSSTFRTPGGAEFHIGGIADLIARNRVTGKFWTWDHKFTSKFWTPLELVTDIQQPLYVIAIRQSLGIPVTGILVNQLKTYEYKDWKKVEESQLFARSPGYRTDRELQNIIVNTGLHVDQILSRGPIPSQFPRSLDRNCNFCGFSDLCISRLKGYGSANFHGEGAPYTVKKVLDD